MNSIIIDKRQIHAVIKSIFAVPKVWLLLKHEVSSSTHLPVYEDPGHDRNGNARAHTHRFMTRHCVEGKSDADAHSHIGYNIKVNKDGSQLQAQQFTGQHNNTLEKIKTAIHHYSK